MVRAIELLGRPASLVAALAAGGLGLRQQALELGLVDEIGGLDRAVALAKEKAGIPEDKRIVLEVYPRKKSYFEVILNRMVHGAPDILGGKVLDPEELLERSPALGLLSGNERLAIIPFRIRLH